ncbi:MAG TPA: type II toxin-antitoxin system VapC family toxin [Candidatus Acidoferrum sp.]|nr:type II toxin-antitoxin system VapC family toxin [Candidatus Acidoferrum sp.]
MITSVLDASVAVKWLLPADTEPLHDEAMDLLRRFERVEIAFIVPEFFWIEISSVLWKRARGPAVTKSIAQELYRELRAKGLKTVRSTRLVPAAFEIAVTHGSSVYASLYVALAKDRDTFLITADKKLVNAVAAHLPIKWLGAI